MTANPISKTRAQELEVAAWDLVAQRRAQDLDGDRDPSYRYVLAPGVTSLMPPNCGSVIDIGCGVGRFTKTLRSFAKSVVGIDPSAVSARIASQHVMRLSNIQIQNVTISQYALSNAVKHDAAVALMVLQDVVDLSGFLHASARTLREGAPLIGAVTHPRHWPEYWGYSQSPWFDYEKEIYIQSEFRTSLSATGVKTLHVHRPTSMYLDAFSDSGFGKVETWEPMMEPSVQRLTGVKWKKPHFWFFRAHKK
ncbi:class I SAM-dependent methyltransferase [Nocardioides lacusdianchii]|uniref:class I SAM-dependent methyltransferase n=1 Tax=Nocardioides lacusdianchii TaxID=2783664 RepID=UPI001CCC6DB2|nr:class I SAM-dependent methyltransferase [Nocardioides lacusdianchii]